MKIFNNNKLQWIDWLSSVRAYMNKKLGTYGNGYGPSQIFGQILTVLNSMTQTIMLYIEDALTEQNVYTAERKKSVYSLARLTGYEPSLGTAAKCSLVLQYHPTNVYKNIIIPDRTTITSLSNGLNYNILIPNESIHINTSNTPQIQLTCVEGNFESQSFISSGGPLYSVNVQFNGDIDIDYLTVSVDGETYNRVDSLYDMNPYDKSYVSRISLDKGIDVIFGNGQYGNILEDGQSIIVEYLVHSGELGNISTESSDLFLFKSSIKDNLGDLIDGNSVFICRLSNKYGVTSGSYSEDPLTTQQMIGYNSRSMVLADTNNYKLLLSRYSFIGYNRCWSEPGAMTINAMCIKNYKQLISEGLDYFNLSESDFYLSTQQKESIKESIINSGSQYCGTIFNFIDPKIKKYSMFIYVKMKSNVLYDNLSISNEIRNIVGNFFSDLYSDIYIPKSDIIHSIKSKISSIDGIDIFIMSEDNEKAKLLGYYDNEIYVYKKATESYDIITERVYVDNEEDLHLGLDEFGNILLDNDTVFPVLMGNWGYGDSEEDKVQINDPLNIIFI